MVTQARLSSPPPRWLLAAAAVLAAGCGPSTPAPRPKPPTAPDAGPTAPRAGRIFFECSPAEAQIVVDGSPRGTAEELSRAGGLSLPLGLHRFEISHAGFRSFRIELDLGEKPERLRVQLNPVATAP